MCKEQINKNILDNSEIKFTVTHRGFYLFREGIFAKADFYPTTGRWVSKGKCYDGGAVKFIEWIIRKRIEIVMKFKGE